MEQKNGRIGKQQDPWDISNVSHCNIQMHPILSDEILNVSYCKIFLADEELLSVQKT